VHLIAVQGRAKDGSDDRIRFMFREDKDDLNSRRAVMDFREDVETAGDAQKKWEQIFS
jgi:hypothetical protein